MGNLAPSGYRNFVDIIWHLAVPEKHWRDTARNLLAVNRDWFGVGRLGRSQFVVEENLETARSWFFIQRF